MNVRKLKHDMWRELEAAGGAGVARSGACAGDENTPPDDIYGRPEASNMDKTQGRAGATPPSPKSFQTLIKDINKDPGSQQKDASLPFYFICLLHLANEKVLTRNQHHACR